MTATMTYPEPRLAADPAPLEEPTRLAGRIASIDVFRGFVMFLMMAEMLRLPQLAKHFADNPVWQAIGFHTSHVEWTGCSLHDLIQPGFSFLVGVALPFSIASRRLRGQSLPRMVVHAAWRALLLVALGIFLRSVGQPQTNFIFTDTLGQIGLGYVFLFLLGLCPVRWQVAALVAILLGYWCAFAFYPAPPADFNYVSVGVPADWPYHFNGFMSHWNKNSNAAAAFDVWFLNLFPRKEPFVFSGGGYATLSFIPTLGTMTLGLIAGGWLRNEWTRQRRLLVLCGTGLACLALGWAAEAVGICPIVKRIWTPAWVLYSGGWCLLLLAGFHLVCDIAGLKWWAFPLIVIGMNSIAIYVMANLMKPFIFDSFKTHLGGDAFKGFGAEYEQLLRGAAGMVVFWLILYWMYRRKIFLRI